MKDSSDNVKQQIQSRLSGFEAPLPHDGWQRIESSLNKASRAAAIRRKLWYSGVAAAIAMLIAGGFFLSRQFSMEEHMDGSFAKQNPPALPSVTKQPADAPGAEHPVAPENKKLTAAHSPAPARRTTQSQNPEENILTAQEKLSGDTSRDENPILEKNAQEEKTAAAPKETNGIEKEREATKSASSQKPGDEERLRLIEEFANAAKRDDLFASADRKENRPHQKRVLAFQGKGGLSSYSAESNAPMTLRSMKGGEEDSQSDNPSAVKQVDAFSNSLTTTNIASNMAEKHHSQPVSFGITVSKAISDRFSIETGLIYTYLYSHSKNMGDDALNQDSQHLHYLGIPINVNYIFASLDKLDIYGTVGATIEKDVYGKANYYDKAQSEAMSSSSERQQSRKIKQSNAQFSINTGVGVSYPLVGNVRLYGKIGGAYYFDADNEYPTIYSDKKLMMDMNVGLKIEF